MFSAYEATRTLAKAVVVREGEALGRRFVQYADFRRTCIRGGLVAAGRSLWRGHVVFHDGALCNTLCRMPRPARLLDVPALRRPL